MSECPYWGQAPATWPKGALNIDGENELELRLSIDGKMKLNIEMMKKLAHNVAQMVPERPRDLIKSYGSNTADTVTGKQ